MSADNAIFVKEIGGKWYTRHQQMPFIENVEYCEEHPETPDPWTWDDVDKEMKKRGKQYDTRQAAIMAAFDEVHEMYVCEYGVIEI